MFEIPMLLILIPALPLAATLLCAALGPRWLRSHSHLPVIVAILLSCTASVLLVFAVQRDAQQQAARGLSQVSSIVSGRDAGTGIVPFPKDSGAVRHVGYEKIVTLWQWASVADNPLPQGQRDFRIDVTLRADPLTAVMLATVTFISLLVAVYSVGYMRGDPGYWRFFTYIGLFVFSMTMLVSVSNFVMLYVFWEGVGLCSYLLIGFWFDKPAAAAAGMKAFLVNRVGDFGFALGLFLLWITYGTLDFHDSGTAAGVAPGILGQTLLQHPGQYAHGAVGTAICLLLMLGACGKSAQFPLHVWLPDAMEGPTPVSALIHAATMVTAGVYMVVRCTPLFAAAPDAQHVVAAIGGFTALMAALIALTQTDLKRILAYSTISQLGYMFLGLGAGSLLGISAGMFHLVTHAFFKALLFLGAGSVMHAMGGVIDLRQLGGLRHRLPTTCWTFLFGCLALAGIFPFAGFWSKDAILAAVHLQAVGGSVPGLYYVLYLAGMGTALLTALYTFRAFFLTFFGPERLPAEAGQHAHESPSLMTLPLVILAIGALVVGAYFQSTGDFLGPQGFLAQTPSLAYSGVAHAAAEGQFHWNVAVSSTLLAVAGVLVAMVLYLGSPIRVEMLTRCMAALGLYELSQGKFLWDPIYRGLVVWPLQAIADLFAWLDRYVIDGLVNLIGRLPPLLGAMLRPVQSGLLQFYALAMVLGLLVLIGALLL
jgi:NADH-quinone oxidoreductase subunit L